MRMPSSVITLAFLLCAVPPTVAAAQPTAEGTSGPAFTDQAIAAGIDFQHVFGDPQKKYIVEAKGGGAGFFDYDADGDIDLYVVNGATLDTYRDKSGPGNALYRNLGDGTFDSVSAAARVDDAGWGNGCAVGDINNDGFRDLYVTNYGDNVLYRNRGDGSFADISATSGTPGNQFSTSAAFLDYDNDGDLDLYVTHYVVFDVDDMPDDATQEKLCVFLGGVVYCGPGGMPGTRDILYRNEGDDTFADVSTTAGIDQVSDKYGLGVVPQDYDGDGDLDLFVANDATPNLLFQNKGDGSFANTALLAGVAYNADGDEEAGMGVDFGDIDNDGDADLIVTHFFSETNTLYRNDGSGSFTDVTAMAGLAAPTINSVGFGTGFFDYDSDGDLDLFFANGHVYPHISLVAPGGTYRQPNQLFRNDGLGHFVDVSAASGPGLALHRTSRGSCMGDYDNDGDVDVFVVNMNDTPSLLRNESDHGANWLTIHVVGTRSNRDGVGTLVRVKTSDRTQTRTINGASSYMSHRDIRAHVGLGKQRSAMLVELTWPDGEIQAISDVPANQLLVVRQGQGHDILPLGSTAPPP